MMENITAVALEISEYVRVFNLQPAGPEIMDEFVMILVGGSAVWLCGLEALYTCCLFRQAASNYLF